MKKHFCLSVILFIFLLVSSFTQAQKSQNQWVFGKSAQVDFNWSVPVTHNLPYTASEGCASISDANGDLLFFTNGQKILDKNGNIMPHGSGLSGSQSSAQSAIIVPDPGNANRYYVFTTHDWREATVGAAPTSEFCFSIVDMTLGTNGDLVLLPGSVYKKIIQNNIAERVTATKHANCTDYWIITHEIGNSNYVAYQLSSAGLSPSVVSAVGAVANGGPGNNRYGGLRCSHDGTWLCSAFGNAFATEPTVEIFNFNRSTGAVRNLDGTTGNLTTTVLSLGNDINRAYSSEFSEDNSKLYVTGYSNNFIYQFNLSLPASLIASSRKNISASGFIKSALQMGPDHNIYVVGSGVSALGVIRNTNDIAPATVQYTDNAIVLATGTSGYLGLPNFLSSGSLAITASSYSLCPGASTTLTVSGGDPASYTWTPTTGLLLPIGPVVVANPAVATTYTVSGTAFGCPVSQSVVINRTTANAGPNVSICGGNAITIGTPAINGCTYSWSPASSLSSSSVAMPSASPSVNTTYTVTVTDGNGCAVTSSTVVTVDPPTTFTPGTNGYVCAGYPYQIGGPSIAGYTYLWTPATGLSSTTISNPVSTPAATTNYTVKVTNATGCTATGSVLVTVNATVANAGSNNTICQGQSIPIGSSPVIGNTYSWSPAASLSSSVISNPIATPPVSTTYTVQVTIGSSCTVSSQVEITVTPNPTVTVTPDLSIICLGSSVTLTASGATSYLWSPSGSLSSATAATVTATPLSHTTYTVVGTTGACTGSAQAYVAVLNMPSFPLTAAGAPSTTLTSQDVQVDPSGNTFVSGFFADPSVSPITFFGQFNNKTITPASPSGFYLVKYNMCGDPEWIAFSNNVDNSVPVKFDIDNTNNILYLIAGYQGLNQITDGQNNPVVVNSASPVSVILKMNAVNGSVLLYNNCFGPATDITVNSSVYIIGKFEQQRPHVSRYTTALGLIALTHICERGEPMCIEKDPAGNIYVTGSFQDIISTATSTLTNPANGPTRDIFILKYLSTLGLPAWGLQGSSAGIGNAVTYDVTTGLLYAVGTFSGTVFQTTTVPPGVNTTGFLCVVDPATGNKLNSVLVGTNDQDAPMYAKADGAGTVYVLGNTISQLLLFPPAGAVNTAPGAKSLFLARYVGLGFGIAGIVTGTGVPGDDVTSGGLGIDNGQNPFITGRYKGSLTLNKTITSIGSDMFVARVDRLTGKYFRQGVRGQEQSDYVMIYPNPLETNSSVVINLKQREHMSINIYNVSGQLVQNVYDETMEAGESTVAIRADKLSAGIYIVSATSSSLNKQIKVVVNR